VNRQERDATMTTRTLRRTALAAALAAILAPAAAHAADAPRLTAAQLESLSPQDREMYALASEFSRRCAETLERWVVARETTEEKLFSALYFPIPKTDPRKFTTAWDHLSDRDILPIEEGVLAKSPLLTFAVMVDRNGYLPTHNQRYAMPLTGNGASDLVNNRTKRIFNDRTGLAAVRNSKLGALVQRYQRDSGEVLADLSVPIYVNGAHWGAVRLGYRVLDAR
jgi:hypothetical protein